MYVVHIVYTMTIELQKYKNKLYDPSAYPY